MSDVVLDVTNSPFPCNGCGLCCEHVHQSPETAFLDGGNGSCRHFNAVDRRCTIYASRPDICRVDRQYVLRFHTQCTWDEFVTINLQACRHLADLQERVDLRDDHRAAMVTLEALPAEAFEAQQQAKAIDRKTA